MEFVSGSRKGTVEIYPPDALHFTRLFGVTQLASIQLYNNSTDCVAYKLRTTSPAEIKFRPGYGFLQPFRMKKILVRCTLQPEQFEEREERCTLVAHVLPEGIKTVDAYDYWRTTMFTNLIDQTYRLPIKFDLDSYDVPEPFSTSSYTSSSIIASTSSPDESNTTTTTSSEYVTTSSSTADSGTDTTSSSTESAITVSSSTNEVGSTVSATEASGLSEVSVDSFTVGTESTASNGSFTQQSY